MKPWIPMVLLCVAFLTGCQNGEQGASGTTSSRSASSADAAQVPLDVRSWEETEQLVADRQGQVVVIDIWSTSCVPCMREFPNLVELHREYPGQVACMSVNVDYIGLANKPPESYRGKVFAFLEEQEAAFPNMLSSDADEDLLRRLELTSIPAVLVYDREGKLHKRFDNGDGEYGDEGFNYEQHIIPLVEELLKG